MKTTNKMTNAPAKKMMAGGKVNENAPAKVSRMKKGGSVAKMKMGGTKKK